MPALMSLDYIFRVLKWSVVNLTNFRIIDMWEEMFFDGLKVFIVQLVYFIIISAIIFIGIWTSIIHLWHFPMPEDCRSRCCFEFNGRINILGLALTVVSGAFFTIALANMGYCDGELISAFRFRKILGMNSKIGWVDVYSVVCNDDHHRFQYDICSQQNWAIPIQGLVLVILILYPYINLLIA